MSSECKKCSKILLSFIDPRQSFGPDKIIPPNILASAKGLAVITVFKAGFLGSGRFGNGIVVARLDDGTWSAPSAIATAGAGFGGQIGFELTDFVFILNDKNAVRTFSQAGSLTLGGNVSIAAGPVGRNAEAAGAASLKGVAGVFAYSKTKGLFAGVSLEGSAIIERRDANEKMYGSRVKAADLLMGSVRPPPQAQPLMTVLNSRVFSGVGGSSGDSIYNDVPVYDNSHDDVIWEGRRGSAYGEGQMGRDRTGSMRNNFGRTGSTDSFGVPKRASTWQDDVYDRGPTSPLGSNPTGRMRSNSGMVGDDYVYRDKPAGFSSNSTGAFGGKSGPGRPSAPKPMFKDKTGALGSDEAVALFTFDADQPGDLGFKKGDVIRVTKKTDSTNDWWTGTIGGRTGIFPSNYVEMRRS